MSHTDSPSDGQIDSFIAQIMDQYGFDFKDYARASFRRRITAFINSEGIDNILQLQEAIIANPIMFERFVHSVTVSVTSMFRDPSFYLAFRKEVVPLLATYQFIRVWHAGCATGEEVYSTAILLHEEGLYERSRIYATDLDLLSVEKAKAGVFSLAQMKDYSSNYIHAGGPFSLSRYYTADHENALVHSHLKKNIVFARHNLVSDKSFNEFHLVLCRNVLIYFNNDLREQVLLLLHDSLRTFGVLGLGSSESLRFSNIDACYKRIAGKEKLYKRII